MKQKYWRTQREIRLHKKKEQEIKQKNKKNGQRRTKTNTRRYS